MFELTIRPMRVVMEPDDQMIRALPTNVPGTPQDDVPIGVHKTAIGGYLVTCGRTMAIDFSLRFIAYPNGRWWAVWDLDNDQFAKYRGTWLMACEQDEAHRLAKLLNELDGKALH